MSHRLFRHRRRPRQGGRLPARSRDGRPPRRARSCGRWAARRRRPRPLRFLVGRDTRESGEWIERELARGVHSAGAAITTAGVIPTPAIAYVTRAMGFDAGLVISASHNPFEDNGIKVFSGKGEKFTEALEREVEAIVARHELERAGSRGCAGRSHRRHRRLHRARAAGAAGAAAARARSSWRSTPRTAPRRPSRRGCSASSGFDVEVLSAAPDGRNINLDCGSTHPEQLAQAVARARLPHGRGVRRRRRPRDLRRRRRAASSTATRCC